MNSEDVEHSDVRQHPLSSSTFSTSTSTANFTPLTPLQALAISNTIMEESQRTDQICHACNKEQLNSTLVNLPCSHRFCSQCMSTISRMQLCPLCLSGFATNDLSSFVQMSPSRLGTLFPELSHNDLAKLTPESSFSIWNPLAPKALIKHEIQRAAAQFTNQQSTSSYMAADIQCGNSSAHSLMASAEQSFVFQNASNVANASLSSISSQCGAQNSLATLNWNTPTGTEICRFANSFTRCTMCAEANAVATVRCVQCDETLCSECVIAHYRMRVTREHEVVRIEPLRELVSSRMLSSARASNKLEELAASETCTAHGSALVCTCVTCQRMSLCHLCSAEHVKHQLMPYGDLNQSLMSLINTAKSDKKNVEDALETVCRMLERVEACVQSVVRELRSVIHMHISALEERKRDLLHRVDIIRQIKMSTLKTQSERLSQRLCALTEALRAAETAKNASEGLESHQLASFNTLIAILREPRMYLAPSETDHIKFASLDKDLLIRLRNLGELNSGACAQTTHIVGEGHKKAIRDKLCCVQIQACDACGDACSSCSQYFVVTVIGPSGRPVKTNINEQDGGVVIVSYIPTEEGSHMLDVKIRGISIHGCPVVIFARKGRSYANVAQAGPLFSFGNEGTEDGQFCRPWGICCDMKGRIVVADRSNNRIQIFDKDGHFLLKFGTQGNHPGQFDRPAGVVVNSLNEIIVADKDNHRVQVFNEHGVFLLKFGERGRTPGTFNYPWGVAVNSTNQIAVSDTRNHRVQIFSPRGHFIRKLGFDSSLFYKNLDSPRGVCYLPDGQLIITDFNNHRLAVVPARGSSDIKCYGSEGVGEGCFCRPQGVATDNEGHILVCDSRNNRIQVLSVNGMRCIACFGSGHSTVESDSLVDSVQGSASSTSKTSSPPPSSGIQIITTLDRPADLCVSPDGLIYVVDFGSNCVRVF